MARRERYRRCKRCGNAFQAINGTEKALCDACRAAAKRESVVRPRTCTVCGLAFPGGPAAKYCPQCRRERQRERDKAYKRNGAARKLGSTQICERCGAPYTLDGGQQRYCPSCSAEAIRENRRPKKRAYQQTYDPDHKKRNALRDGVRLCVICGEPITGDRQKRAFNTCSETCERQRKSTDQAKADLKRGRRRTIGKPQRAPNLPNSGIPGVTARRRGKPWQAQYRGHYIGVFDTIDEAAAAIDTYKAQQA